MTGPWVAHETEPSTVHVVPIDDLIAHEATEDCPCGPSVIIDVYTDAPDGHTWVHASLDGREAQGPDR